MSEYFEVAQFKVHNDKWRKTRLGYARRNKKDNGWDAYFDALPTPDEKGMIRVSILEPQQDGSHAADPAKQGPQDGEPSDEIPF